MPDRLILPEMSENTDSTEIAEIPSNAGCDFESLVKESISENHGDDDSSGNEEDIKFCKKKRIIASDSEEETLDHAKNAASNTQENTSDDDRPKEQLNTSKRRIKLVSDDSSVASETEKFNDDEKNEDNLPLDVECTSNKKATDIDRTAASDSDSQSNIPPSYMNVFKNSDVFAAESSSDGEIKPSYNNNNCNSDSDAGQRSKNTKQSKSKSKKLTKKKPVTQKQRDKEFAEITSRTQKMLRESRVSLPYHRPRQLTLDEFIKKRHDAKVPILTSIIKSSRFKAMGGKIVIPDASTTEKAAEVHDDVNITQPAVENSIPNEEPSSNFGDDTPYPVQDWLKTVSPNNVEDLADDISPISLAEIQQDSNSVLVKTAVAVQENSMEIDSGDKNNLDEIKICPGNQEKLELNSKDIEDAEMEEKFNDEVKVETDNNTEDRVIEMEFEKKSNLQMEAKANDVEMSRKVSSMKPEEIINITTEDGQLELGGNRNTNSVDKNEKLSDSTMYASANDRNRSNIIENSSGKSPVLHGSINTGHNLKETEVLAIAEPALDDQLAEQEADLNAYLESMKPKPKRLSLAERLKQIPGYENLSNLKPKIGQGTYKNSKGMIDLSKGSKPASRNKSSGIQTLMDRFIHHTNVIKPAKEQHFKIHVSKKEEDSQGQEHVTVDEVDYIKITNSDDEEKMGSPSQVPGSRMIRVQEQLKQKIYAQKAKEFAEKMKLHAMYAEEKELEDKNTDFDPLPDEEEEIEEMSESEIDDDEEEELEELLSGTRKEKRRKRHVYVDDEAEDSDDGVDADNEDQDDESSDDDDDENHDNDLPSIHDDNSHDFGGDFDEGFPISDTLPSAQPQMDKQKLTEAASNSSVKINIERLDMNSTPSDLWLRPPAPRCPISVSVGLEKLEEISDSGVTNQMSEIEEEISQENSLSASDCKSPIPSVVADLLEGVGDSNVQNNEDILAVCSGTFPTQQPATPEESQNCFGFDDDEDDIILATLDESGNKVIETPKPADNACKSVLENDTPKLSEKISTTKRLFFGENANEANATPKLSDNVSKSRLFSSGSPEGLLENYDSEDNESLVGVRVVRKRKRLEFSDEEDDEKPHESEINEEDIADDDEEMAMEVKERTVIPRKSLFGKDGRLKKQFIEAEAELSGSEEGSEDEDERGLDKMEIEEGDEEIIDEDDVREKVGRAHLKALLDQDDEEIQYIQNELLHDGDLHMENERERNFKWNYMTYDLDDDGANMGDFGEETAIDEAEVKRQIEKAEKSKWIKENSQLFEESQQESQKSLLENSGFLKLSKASLKKFTSFSESSSFHGNDIGDTSIAFTSFTRLLTGQVKNIITTNSSEKKSDEAPLCKATSQPLFASPDEPISKLRRGSFLSRGAPTLSRLAEMTKIGDSFSNIKSNSKNFVFSVVTPPEVEDSKSKKTTLRRNQSLTANPKKMLKIDRSFSSLDDSSKDASIFKWM